MIKPLYHPVALIYFQIVLKNGGIHWGKMNLLGGCILACFLSVGCKSPPPQPQLPRVISVGQGYEGKVNMTRAEAILVLEPILKARYQDHYATNYQASTPDHKATTRVFKSIDENGYTLSERTCVTDSRSGIMPDYNSYYTHKGTVTINYHFENEDVYYKFSDLVKIRYIEVHKDRTYVSIIMDTSRTLLPFVVYHEYPLQLTVILENSDHLIGNSENEESARIPLCSSLDRLISALVTLCPNVK